MTGGAFSRRNLYLTRAVLVALLAALVSLAILCVRLYAQNTNAAVESEVLRSMQLSVEQAKNNLDYRLQQTSDSARTLLGTVYPYLNSNAGTEGQIEEYSDMTRVLNEYVGKYMISKVRLFVPKDKIYSRQGETFYSLSSLENDQDFKNLVGDRRGGVFWQGPRRVTTDIGSSILAISCVAVVSGSKNYNQYVGALYLDIDVGKIGGIFQAGGAEGTELYLVNGDGVVIAHADKSRVGETALGAEQMAQIKSEGSGSFSGDRLTAFGKIDSCDWYLVGAIDRAALPRAGGATAGLLVVLIAATLLVALGLAMMIAYDMMLGRTTLSINQAIQALESENGQAAEGKKPGRMDALARLRSSAGKMAFAAQKIVEERYQNRLAISEYQMQALQAQIKPHFLYNTLDVIKWMIADGDMENGVWMVNALSKYLRMSINKGPGTVALNEEVALTQNYLGIMQRRFKNAFRVEIEVEPEAMGCHLPRFSLQPLVENALIHGLIYCDKPDRKLTLRAWLEGDRVIIEVEDNGKGMSEEARVRLETREAGRDAGYGVANVRKRLMLFGGAAANLKVASREGAGTCVTITLPARFDGGEPEGKS
jgi:two-component system sensor histidine kinase YesM